MLTQENLRYSCSYLLVSRQVCVCVWGGWLAVSEKVWVPSVHVEIRGQPCVSFLNALLVFQRLVDPRVFRDPPVFASHLPVRVLGFGHLPYGGVIFPGF